MSNLFKRRREELGLTQRAVSASLDVTIHTIANWERGESLPRPELFDQLAEIYQVTPEQIAIAVMELARARREGEAGAATAPAA